MIYINHKFPTSRSEGSNSQAAYASGGFALVIALSLMAFVLLLILSISTLVQVQMASSANGVARLEARQAALLSLNLAIGKLQETAGLDQRVTAPAESVAGATDGVKQLTGVWRSWEGSDHQANGLPIAPDYDSKLDGGDLDIAPALKGEGRFLGWLVSSATDPIPEESGEAKVMPSLVEVPGTTVPLVSTGSVDSGGAGDEEDEVHVQPTELADGSAAIAWWISGENTKALLRAPEDTVDYDRLDWSGRLASSNNPDANTFEITDADNQAKLDRVASRSNLDELSDRASDVAPVSADYFHDLTAYSRGLLTNTANGGWRRDLSLMAEQWDTLASPSGGSSFPFYTLEPGRETAAVKNSGAIGGLIYPWASESDFDVEFKERKGGASVGWGALADFALQYKNVVAGSASGNVTVQSKLEHNIGGGTFDFSRDALSIRPVLARIHWVFRFESKVDPNDATQYLAYLNAIPVMTYWNPYNVAITGFEKNGSLSGWGDYSFWTRLSNHFPYKFQFKVGSTEQDQAYSLNYQLGNKVNVVCVMPVDTEVWQPGEARVYSPRGYRNSQDQIWMQRGYELSAAGFSRQLYESETKMDDPDFVDDPTDPNDSPSKILIPLSGADNDSFTVKVSIDTTSDLRMELLNMNGSITQNVGHLSFVSASDIAAYWPVATIENTSQTMRLLSEGVPSPFLVAMFQLHNIYERSSDTRGYSHNKPITGYLSSNKTGKTTTAGDLSALVYDWVFKYPQASSGVGTDGGMPVDVIDESDPYSFVGTSYTEAQGLKSLIVAEIPTKPLRSLGELQHFDVGFYAPMAPYVAEPIGNSNASYLIEPDQVFVNDGYTEEERTSYDHSYVGNHLFFDDWFVSSIAPETDGYSSYPASEARDTQKVYEEFVTGDTPLPNKAYRPAEILSTSEASTAASSLISNNSAWHSVASQLEVDGMFNINSTSVEAWTALLQHLKDGAAPYVSVPDTSSTDWNIELDTGTGHPVSRTTVAGDPLAGPTDYYSAIGQHARLTDTQIEALATEIVNQVKKRGPFLSLSEFVNRQLNTDESASSLALAGAIEAALTELSTQGASENPYTDLQATFAEEVAVPSGMTHAFPEAAEGNIAYGFPGWVRQADILRPLAPVLSARDDTFVIRAYGESKDPISGETQSGAWCEAVVQRRADYVDSVDESTILPSDSTLSSKANKHFGRRFTIVSFRWLSPDEV